MTLERVSVNIGTVFDLEKIVRDASIGFFILDSRFSGVASEEQCFKNVIHAKLGFYFYGDIEIRSKLKNSSLANELGQWLHRLFA